MSTARFSELVQLHQIASTRFVENTPLLQPLSATIQLIFPLASEDFTAPGALELLLEWMLRGTKELDREQLGQAFGALGATPVLSMSNGSSYLHLQCLDSVRDAILPLARELLFNPRFDPEELEKTLDELDEDDDASMDDSEEICQRAQLRARWAGSSFQWPATGTPQFRRAIDAQSLKALHAEIFRAPCIVGISALQPEIWRQAIQREFLQNRPVPSRVYTPLMRPMAQIEPKDIVINAPMMEHVSIHQFCPGPANDLRSIAATHLHHAALTEGMSAPFMSELRGQNAISYSVSSRLVDRNEFWDQVYEVEPEPKRIDEALLSAHQLWTTPSELTDEDLDRARIQLRTSNRLMRIESADVIATVLREAILRERPISWLDELVDMYEEISNDEIRQAALSYGLSQEALCTVVVGPAKKMPKPWAKAAQRLEILFQSPV